MKKISPFLWFDSQAEEAMKFYTSIFKNSKIINIKYWGENNPFPDGNAMAGKVMNGTFELDGQLFQCMDAGPQFKFTEAISMFVSCKTQEEVDYFWEKLTADGGQESMCGWLKDKFGLSWQIVPTALEALLHDPDPEKSQRVMQAMLQMKKIDIDALKQAHEQG
ncbi:VOC family protein [candidate division KSB1 bacterium]|nr:VOC family protein [candidate division KSB1 bacterium]NIV68550.1 VOC family protein [Phycisphaerae bacterium]NIR69105.1 VOC family protein [candidate division KSB1 bacterium]NIS22636.1 VOC family protein [candidate division KSB1 bacterium]NIT69494.1 VOC family protein [candidate division KSB1 bacterium]